MSTVSAANPISESSKSYFKKEFWYLLKSHAAYYKLLYAVCNDLGDAVGNVGWSLERHLTWFMSHFNVEPQDYEFCYIKSLIDQPNWQGCYEHKWEKWLDQLVAPSDADVDAVLQAFCVNEEENT